MFDSSFNRFAAEATVKETEIEHFWFQSAFFVISYGIRLLCCFNLSITLHRDILDQNDCSLFSLISRSSSEVFVKAANGSVAQMSAIHNF